MVDEAIAKNRSGAARCVLAVRRMMREAIAEDVVHNAAVDMLLTLFLAADDEWVASADVCAATLGSDQSCRRWGAVLAERDLVVIEHDRYRLSARGRAVMEDVNEAIWSIANEHLGSPAASR